MKKLILFSLLGMAIAADCNSVHAQAQATKTKHQRSAKTTTMNNKDYTTTITVDKSPKEAYDAINNVRGWWQGEIAGNTDVLNEEFEYRMPGVHYSKQKITELVPGQKIVWLVTDSKLEFAKDKSEWTGTKISFDITVVDGKTQVRFTHTGLVPAFECYDNCSNAWGMLVGRSLSSLIDTGVGVKVF